VQLVRDREFDPTYFIVCVYQDSTSVVVVTYKTMILNANQTCYGRKWRTLVYSSSIYKFLTRTCPMLKREISMTLLNQSVMAAMVAAKILLAAKMIIKTTATRVMTAA
jgi:hypothetical protein